MKYLCMLARKVPRTGGTISHSNPVEVSLSKIIDVNVIQVDKYVYIANPHLKNLQQVQSKGLEKAQCLMLPCLLMGLPPCLGLLEGKVVSS